MLILCEGTSFRFFTLNGDPQRRILLHLKHYISSVIMSNARHSAFSLWAPSSTLRATENSTVI
jgi:hypothetical protein